jgi:hypothetical protein
MEFPWLLAVCLIAVGIGLLAILSARLWLERRRAREVQRAMQGFKLQRELLEAKFFDLAASLGKPRGLRWVDCEWLEKVTFARDLSDGLLTAFVAVNISFEAIAGGDMEDVAAVGNIREAAAVFHYRKGRWGTGGRALFNMNPEDAVSRLQGQYEPIVLEAN